MVQRYDTIIVGAGRNGVVAGCDAQIIRPTGISARMWTDEKGQGARPAGVWHASDMRKRSSWSAVKPNQWPHCTLQQGWGSCRGELRSPRAQLWGMAREC